MNCILRSRLVVAALAAVLASSICPGDTANTPDRATILRVLERAEEAAAGIQDSDAKAAQLGDAAAIRACVGDLEAALRLAKRVGEEGSRDWAFETIAAVQSRLKDFKGALNTAASISPGAKYMALGTIAAAQAWAGDIQGALRTAREISNDTDRSSVLDSIARAQAQAGDVTGALNTLAEITDHTFGAGDISSIGLAQADAGDIKGALETAKLTESPASEVWLLTHIAELQAKGGDKEGAAASYERAFETASTALGAEQRIQSLLLVADSQSRTGDRAAAAQNYQRAIMAARVLNDGVSSRVGVLVQVGVSQAKAGDPGADATFGQARELANQIDAPDSRAMTLISIASAEASVGRAEAAASIRRQVVQLVPQFKSAYRDDRLREIAHVQAWTGDAKGARETVALMADESMRSMTREEIAVAQAMAGDTAGALETEAAIESAAYHPSALSKIATIRAQAGSEGVAEARRIAARIPSPDKKASTLARIAAIQAWAGDWEAALSWAEKEASPLDRCCALLGVAGGILKRVDPEMARLRRGSWDANWMATHLGEPTEP
jgi:tetratricopeptide (TPR) repeat protein